MKTVTLTTIILLSNLLLNLPSQAQCHIDDWTALKALYESTDGDNWNYEHNFNYYYNYNYYYNIYDWKMVKANIPPTDCNLENLDGVKLDENGRVYYLSLSSNKLNGNLPVELGNLSNLIELYLGDNKLNGNIPTELGNLSNLEKLYLGSNQLNGNIPAELGSLSNLTDLNLQDNKLSGCYDENLAVLCDQLENNLISQGNNFEASWQNFCKIGIDICAIPKCNIEDWIALKALYESTDGDNWYRNNNWEVVKPNIPPTGCNLGNIEGVKLDENGRVYYLSLSHNKLNGNLPVELGNLNNLTHLDLGSNQLNGNIPTQISNLNNLTKLRLSDNQLSGNIPSKIGNLEKLNSLNLKNNQLNGNIPCEIGNLHNLVYLTLESNQFSGTFPSEIAVLPNLEVHYLGNNQLSGVVPKFSSDVNPILYATTYIDGPTIDIKNNHYTCTDISINFKHNKQFFGYAYSQQIFTPLNYKDIKTNVFNQDVNRQQLTLSMHLPWENTKDFTYQWYRNGDILPEATQAILNIDSIKSYNVGKYSLHITSENCLPDGNTFETISEPIYVILKGYDLLGQPIEYTQLMVEFENQEEKDQHEQEIFLDNGGIWADKCDCNRELHLYDFPNDSSSIERAYIALDKKIKRGKARNKMDGGFNYKLNNVGLKALSVQMPAAPNQLQNPSIQIEDTMSYSVNYNYPSGNYNSAVEIYLLDSGLDVNNFEAANDFLHPDAPIDNCYNFSASGYNYTPFFLNLRENDITIDTDYKDREGHGTFGFRSISQGLTAAEKAKIVPLKIIEDATDGSLFDLICAFYHAIDHNADVINISAGYRGEPSGILEDAIYEAREKDIFVVAAAGNEHLNIDEVEVPQYPAYYASQYHKFYTENGLGEPKLDSVPYDNLITVASVNFDGELSAHSNYGQQSVSIAAPGENIYGHGLEGVDAVGSGTSIATFLATQVLAREIARDNNRSLQEIRSDFESRYLVSNPKLTSFTKTGKQLNFDWETKIISGCTNESACNYYPYATVDDGTCYTCVEPDCMDCSESCPPCSPAGCTDATACNFSSYATIEDGSCEYNNGCASETDLVICPNEKQVNICAPVSAPAPLSLEDFSPSENVTLSSALSLQVIQKTDAYKYYNTTTYDYIITDGAGNQNTCQTQYHIANQFLQSPEMSNSPMVCQDELWSYIKLGVDEYKIYGDQNGSQGQELTTCNTPGLHCSTSGLAVNTSTPGTRQFWVTEFFTFPDGTVCESEATPFQVSIQPKPVASLSTQNTSLNLGEGIPLMDMVSNNTSGFWTGENIIYLMTAQGENIPYFSANATGVFKLYYTVKNDFCERSYLLIVNVGGAIFATKEIGELAQNDYRINDKKSSQAFTIYPNPSTGKIHIELNGNREDKNRLTIFDLTGKVLHQSQFEDKFTTLDLSELARGMYMVKVQNELSTDNNIQKLLIE